MRAYWANVDLTEHVRNQMKWNRKWRSRKTISHEKLLAGKRAAKAVEKLGGKALKAQKEVPEKIDKNETSVAFHSIKPSGAQKETQKV